MPVLEINYKNIEKNIAQFNVESSKIIAVVKNNAYNMELEDCVKTMYLQGIKYFATTNLNEAITIRKLYSDVNIFLINPTIEFDKVREYSIEINIPSLSYLQDNLIKLQDLDLHLEFAGSMNRAGAKTLEEAVAIVEFAKNNSLNLKAFWAHFAFADEFDGNYEKEKELLLNIYKEVSLLYEFKVVHFQNSASYLRDGMFDMVTHIRPGIMLYGSYPYNIKENPTKEKYKPNQAFEVRANILNTLTLEEGESIGYSNSYVAGRRVRLATVDIGYGDGILRSRLTGKTCIVNDKEYKILSTMMSHIVLEIDEQVNIGDEVIIYSDRLPIYEYNKYCNSNSEQMAVLNKNSLEVVKKY